MNSTKLTVLTFIRVTKYEKGISDAKYVEKNVI